MKIPYYENACLSMQYLKSDADFLKAKTVNKVKKLLNAMDNEIKKNLKYVTILRSMKLSGLKLQWLFLMCSRVTCMR